MAGQVLAILGIGSPLGADNVGWQALDQLEQQAWVQATQACGALVLAKLDRPGMDLLNHLAGYERVILIDAVIAPEHTPGAVLTLKREALALLAAPASTHGLGVAEALAMGAVLGVLPEQLEIWGIVVAA